MSFLKKLAPIVNFAFSLFGLARPLVSATAPSSAPVLDKLDQGFGVIITAEQMFAAAMGPDAKSGSQKLAASAPYIGQLLASASALAGKKPKDPDAAGAAAAKVASGLADFLNAYGE